MKTTDITHDMAVRFLTVEAKDLFKKAVVEWKKNVEPKVKKLREDHTSNVTVFYDETKPWYDWIKKNISAKGYCLSTYSISLAPRDISLQNMIAFDEYSHLSTHDESQWVKKFEEVS